MVLQCVLFWWFIRDNSVIDSLQEITKYYLPDFTLSLYVSSFVLYQVLYWIFCDNWILVLYWKGVKFSLIAKYTKIAEFYIAENEILCGCWRIFATSMCIYKLSNLYIMVAKESEKIWPLCTVGLHVEVNLVCFFLYICTEEWWLFKWWLLFTGSH